jgi:signal transduction histidine kinase
VQLVRIVQEALANVRKHAQARRVNVVLSTADDRLHVLIRDDGNGFRLTEERHQFGLKTMRERAETVGGLLVVDSTPGKGTIVSLQLPLLTSGAAVV